MLQIITKFFESNQKFLNKQVLEEPTHLVLVMTYQCQLKCKMCVQVDVPKEANNSQLDFTKINVEKLKEQINKLSKLKTAYLFGGEPLIHKEIFELCRFLNQKKIKYSYSTNGLLLKKYCESILADPPQMISVSLDGHTPELHDEIRRMKGSWKKAIEGIDFLIKEKKRLNLKFPKLKIHFTITPDNYDTMIDYYNYYTELFPEIDEIKFHYPRFSTKKMGIEYFELMQKEFDTNCLSYLGNVSEDEFVNQCLKIDYKKLVEDLNILLKKPKTAVLGPVDLEEAKIFFTKPEIAPRKHLCACANSMVIQPNGDVVSCGDYPDLVFGNINEKNLIDIWNSKIPIKWRKFLKKKGNPGVLAKCSRLYRTITK